MEVDSDSHVPCTRAKGHSGGGQERQARAVSLRKGVAVAETSPKGQTPLRDSIEPAARSPPGHQYNGLVQSVFSLSLRNVE